MKVIIPLAGKDERFEKYGDVKPLIDIIGKPLIKHCMDSLSFFKKRHDIHFIVLKEHNDKYNTGERLKKLFENEHNVNVFIQEKPVEGAACTVLQLKEEINNNEPLVIYLADIYFEADLADGLKQNASGIVPCFKSNNPKYSYLKLKNPENLNSEAIEVAEKKVISDNASAGFYYFSKGEDFVWAAEEMIRKNLRVNNMFYICPVYQQLVESGKIVKIIPSIFRFGLGSPEELEAFGLKF
jgi:NDP-sugar pyrophosphorylase family protein